MNIPLYVTFTMDCERIAAESPPGGPKDWGLSERAITGYCHRLLDAGMPPTLFITPECGQYHQALFRDLAAAGVELGMHIHPQSFGDLSYTRYLGEYDAVMQAQLIGAGLAMLTEAFGVRPTSFRPGNFSASDETFPVLVELGFRQGSVSDPGRMSPQFAAVWRGATPDVHWANATDKLQAGSLPFLEVPETTDLTKNHSNGFPYELRLESGPFETWHQPILNQALNRMAAEQTPFRTLCLFTHNYFEYGDSTAPQTQTLDHLIRRLDQLRAEYDLTPATMTTIRAQYEQRFPAPAK
jgi:hypothetical protein